LLELAAAYLARQTISDQEQRVEPRYLILTPKTPCGNHQQAQGKVGTEVELFKLLLLGLLAGLEKREFLAQAGLAHPQAQAELVELAFALVVPLEAVRLVLAESLAEMPADTAQEEAAQLCAAFQRLQAAILAAAWSLFTGLLHEAFRPLPRNSRPHLFGSSPLAAWAKCRTLAQ